MSNQLTDLEEIEEYKKAISERLSCAIEYFGGQNPDKTYAEIVELAKNCDHFKWISNILGKRIKEIENYLLFDTGQSKNYYKESIHEVQEELFLLKKRLQYLFVEKSKLSNSPPEDRIKKNFKNRIKLLCPNLEDLDKIYDKIIGCSKDDFKKHLQSNFTSEMSWDNYGDFWDVDHTIPCRAFDHTNFFHILKCWNYKNLKPLKKGENYTKQDLMKYNLKCSNLRIQDPIKLAKIRDEMLIEIGLEPIGDTHFLDN